MHTLIERMMTTVDDEREVACLAARLATYEKALREIAAYGSGEHALMACRVLAGEEMGWTRDGKS